MEAFSKFYKMQLAYSKITCMRKRFLFCMFICCAYASCAQVSYDTSHNYASPAIEIFKKAKSQKTIGIIMTSTGTAGLIIGGVIFMKGFGKGWDRANQRRAESEMNAGSALTIAGAVVFAASIPISIASVRNKRKAKLLFDLSK